jgi:hypothetical protein
MGILGFVKGFFTQTATEPDLVKPKRASLEDGFNSRNVASQLHRPTMSVPTTSSSRKPRKRNAKGQFVSEA